MGEPYLSGYHEAEQITKKLEKLLDMYPIRTNIMGYLTFIRTVKSALDIMEYAVFQAMYEMDKDQIKELVTKGTQQ